MKRSANLNSDNLKAEFRQKLENYKAAPSENLWDKIELSLDKEEARVYKNRFQLYSWLAAACLALLLAFGMLLIPKKWQQFQNGSTELATNADPQKLPALNQTEKETSASAQESIALNKAETTAPEIQPEPAEAISKISETVGKVAPKVRVSSKANPYPTYKKTETDYLAFNTPATAVQEGALTEPTTSMAAESIAENPAVASAVSRVAKISSDVPAEEITLAATSRKSISSNSPESGVAVMQVSETKENESLAKAAAPAGAIEDQTAIANTFMAQNPTVSAQDLPIADSAKAGLKLSETVAAVALPSEPEKSGKAKKRSEGKTPRWLVSGSYAALSFNSGIKLGSKPYEIPSGNSLISATEKENLTSYQDAVQEYNEQTSGAYSQAAGLAVGFNLTENWAVQTGFGYSKNQEETHATYTFTENLTNSYPGTTNLGQDSGPQTTLQNSLSNTFNPSTTKVSHDAEYTARYSYQFYSVPVSVRYQTAGSGVYYFAASGGSVNWLTSSKLQTESEQAQLSALPVSKQPSEEMGKTNFFRKTLLAVHLQTGLGFRFTPRWQAELAFTGNQFLKPLVKDEAAAGASQDNPRSYGAALSLGYSF